MSIIHRTLSRTSSINTINKNSNKSSRHQIFSANNFYNRTRSRIASNVKGSRSIQRMDSLYSKKTRGSKIFRNSNFVLSNFIKRKNFEQMQRFYNPEIKHNLKEILKNIRSRFVSKYNGIYYPNYIELFNNEIKDKNIFYSLYDCYIINNILNKKDWHSILLLKEYDIFYDNHEFLLRFYDKKERYIIMKYLLSFVYKYDELCYDAKKEIIDSEKKEELITTFHYITSSKYLYEHLLETDSFKGIKYLLKRIDLTNKKAQYDYSYLYLTKNKKLSEENKYIISAIKIVIEFMNNRKFLEKKLIKNLPFEKVPNCIPNYWVHGKDYLKTLQKFVNLKRFKKIGKPGDQTCELINNIEKEKSKNDTSKESKNKLKYQKNVLFNIDEKIIENESSLSNDEENLHLIKKAKKENNSELVNNNINFNYILPFSLYEESEKENKIEKEKEITLKQEEEKIINDYKLINDIIKLSKSDNRLNRDPDIFDIENFIYSFPKFKEKNELFKFNNSKNDLKLNDEKDKNKDNVKIINNDETNSTNKRKNSLFFNNKEIDSFKLNNTPNNKSNKNPLKLGGDLDKNNSIDIINLSKNNSKIIKEQNIEPNNLLKKKNNNLLLSSLSNFQRNSLKSNQRKINLFNKKFRNDNKIEPLSLSPSSNNNISSTIFSDVNHLSQNFSFSQFQKKEREKNIFFSQHNLSSVKNQYLKNFNNNFSFEIQLNKKTNYRNKGIYSFKKTKDFVEGFRQYHNKIKAKRKVLLKNLSSNQSIISLENNSELYNNSSKKRFSSKSPKNSYKIKNLYDNEPMTNIKYLSNYFIKQIHKQKEKEKQNITLKQIIKNSEIYTSELL